jgi:transcriptional regulator with XRE-family HTH domain
MDNTVGEKIKKFRKRAGVSQFELELRIDASPGSISRIESGQVNPTKETLMKISRALNLTTSELGYIQDIKILSPEEIILAISTITKSLDLQEVARNAVDILLELYPNYNGGVILLLDDDNKNILRAKAVTDMPGMDKVYRLIGAPIENFPFDITKSGNGLLVESLLTGEKRVSNDLSEFTKGSIANYIPKLVAAILGYKIGISLPIIFDNSIIGVMLYTKKIDELFSNEEERILQLLSNQIGIAVMNGKQFEQVNKTNL